MKSIEKNHEKAEKAIRGETIGILVEGVSWKLDMEDLRQYETPRAIEEFRKKYMRR
ncbi:hypothetical protein Smar_0752 [Staphylothermus marinus F1]|uniref:Uncharacterized protein n=2 Tax=Staphylothermus marinus TaxID=2280 RepID=A3DMJ3_STAMF|nr:hypothetical protein Smar_0752 [Staphylothermus marinus F1]